MISIIICSRKADISQKLKDNIAATIGCEYELCVIDNSRNEYNIFTAYNEGVRCAKGDILCFMHEDILYRCENWGDSVEEYFASDNQVGCVGVVGTHLLTDTPAGWYQSMLSSGGCMQNINGRSENRQDLRNFGGKDRIEAVAIDGMWFCIPKKLFLKSGLAFDDGTFNGFHCYDIDICLQIRKKGYRVMVVSKVLVEHYSIGDFNWSWHVETEKLYEKWHSALPQNEGVLISEDEIQLRKRMVEQVMVWMKAYAKCDMERKKMLQSYSYRIGKKIVSFVNIFCKH